MGYLYASPVVIRVMGVSIQTCTRSARNQASRITEHILSKRIQIIFHLNVVAACSSEMQLTITDFMFDSIFLIDMMVCFAQCRIGFTSPKLRARWIEPLCAPVCFKHRSRSARPCRSHLAGSSRSADSARSRGTTSATSFPRRWRAVYPIPSRELKRTRGINHFLRNANKLCGRLEQPHSLPMGVRSRGRSLLIEFSARSSLLPDRARGWAMAAADPPLLPVLGHHHDRHQLPAGNVRHPQQVREPACTRVTHPNH